MTRVMAQGTFDLVHPGHLHYLRQSAALGDELVVVIARDSRKQDEKDIVMPEDGRRQVVDALEMVDEAVLGAEDSHFETVGELDPDIVTVGYDQPYEPDALAERLARAGYPGIRVERISAADGDWSSSALRDRLR